MMYREQKSAISCEFPVYRMYATRYLGGGAPENNSDNSAPTLAAKANGTLFFVKRDEFQYALITHKSSEHLIALGRLIESLFAYRWQKKLPLHNKRLRFMSTRSTCIERLPGELILIADACEPERPRIKMAEAVLVVLLNQVHATSLAWFFEGCSPEQMIIEVDVDFQIVMRPALFNFSANC